ncbi:hypothetical protein [Woeseia oceani]|nr:hypothetical protein [Woeseia oceani]
MPSRIHSMLFVAMLVIVSPQLFAAKAPPISDAIRMIVITGDEGIHYERGCAFYELRALLARHEDDAMAAIDRSKVPQFEIRLIGKAGTATVYVGERWMRTATGTATFPADEYERIVALVDKRKGEGVPKDKIDASIRRATKLIQHPKYVEDKRCEETY